MRATDLVVVIWLLMAFSVASPCAPKSKSTIEPKRVRPNHGVNKCTTPLIRKEWRTLTSAEKRQYIAAVKCLQARPPRLQEDFSGSRSRYDDFVASHISQTGYIHFNGFFHPWHRLMVAQYEAELRSKCHYNGAQPYWDWTLDAKSEEAWINSPIFSPVDGFGGNGPYVDSSKDPSVQTRIPGKTGGGCVQDGPFTVDKYIVAMGPGVWTEPNPRCLRRDFAPAFAVSKCNGSEVEWSQRAETFADFDERAQGDIKVAGMTYHPGGHFGVGGELGELANQHSSPGDPLFYLHHGNVDRLWAKWQAKDMKKRTKDIAGPIWQFAPPFHFLDDRPDTSEPVTLDSPMHFSGLLPGEVTIRDAMDTMGGHLCYTYDKF
ncbi:Di-copper centre-containing protein [Coniochaeta ligniaria NRRL 30616]|uniref:Di-copper centre-containing protein n=1 Tax=Coniochaeta ligniaria NRRL 30616 TaxID=1408157 RepID=A0A1J7INL6_9PEZI|nr:Di-copper centre-containing protein [Coniochaeta ligniaria NRRL 30616]